MTFLSEFMLWAIDLLLVIRNLDSDVLLQLRDRLSKCVAEIERELESRQV